MKEIAIAGIGTGVGKTVVASIFTEALAADYWKPVQTGPDEDSDTECVRNLVSHTAITFHPEAYRFPLPASPHAAAAAVGQSIDPQNIRIPSHADRPLVIELAGGLMVPLHGAYLNIDWLSEHALQVVLVSRHYLGSINHTLLSYEALRNRHIPIAGIVFNGNENPSTEEAILRYTGLDCILRVNEEQNWNREAVRQYAEILRSRWKIS